MIKAKSNNIEIVVNKDEVDLINYCKTTNFCVGCPYESNKCDDFVLKIYEYCEKWKIPYDFEVKEE